MQIKSSITAARFSINIALGVSRDYLNFSLLTRNPKTSLIIYLLQWVQNKIKKN